MFGSRLLSKHVLTPGTCCFPNTQNMFVARSPGISCPKMFLFCSRDGTLRLGSVWLPSVVRAKEHSPGLRTKENVSISITVIYFIYFIYKNTLHKKQISETKKRKIFLLFYIMYKL